MTFKNWIEVTYKQKHFGFASSINVGQDDLYRRKVEKMKKLSICHVAHIVFLDIAAFSFESNDQLRARSETEIKNATFLGVLISGHG